MSEETNSAPRVLRRGDQPGGETAAIREVESNSDHFSDTLSNGRTITLRELTAGDLLYMEKALGKVGEMERSLKLAARISTGEGRITFDDLQKLKMKDLKKITTLLGLAGDAGDDDEDDFPNE